VLAVGNRCSPTPLIRTLPLAYGQPSPIISGEYPPRLSSPPRDEPPTVSPHQGRARVLHIPGAEADANAGDRNYLVLAKPNVIMNDIRLRGLAVAGTEASGRKSPDNHAQTARNLRRTLRNAAAGARLIQADGLDGKSAAAVSALLADALEELHRLKRRLDRRIKRGAS
jgi:hypothetical protein